MYCFYLYKSKCYSGDTKKMKAGKHLWNQTFSVNNLSFSMCQKGSFIPNEFNFHNIKSLAIVHVYNGEECYR